MGARQAAGLTPSPSGDEAHYVVSGRQGCPAVPWPQLGSARGEAVLESADHPSPGNTLSSRWWAGSWPAEGR